MGIGNANAIHQFDGFLYLQPMSLESIGTLDNTMHIRIKKKKKKTGPITLLWYGNRLKFSVGKYFMTKLI